MGHRPRLATIIDHLFLAPVFTSAEVAAWGGDKSLPTARRDIDELERAGWIKHLDGEKPRTYYVPGIIAIAYHEGDDNTFSAEPESTEKPGS